MAYQVGKDYSATLEKKNAIGIWSKKVVVLRGLNFSIHDNEGAPASVTLQLTAIQRVPGEPLQLSFVGQDVVTLRAPDLTVSNHWYDLTYTALEVAGKVKPRNCGLPPQDPRNGLRFIEVPVEHSHAFQNLAQSVLYWFEPVKKIGLPSKITGRDSIEERVSFISDQCLYVTKYNSELTRCMKIGAIKRLVTNAPEVKEAFIVVKMAAPEYDLAFTTTAAESFITTLTAVYKAVTKGIKLPVDKAAGIHDSSVALQLNRPAEFQMTLTVPTGKDALKMALDKYAAAHGIQISSTGVAKRVPGGAGATTGKPAAASASPQHGAQTSQSFSSAAGSTGHSPAVKETPLKRFFGILGIAQYVQKLEKQSIDLEVLEVADDDDMANFGITDKAHVKLIRAKLQDADFMLQVHAATTPAVANVPTSPGAVGAAAPPKIDLDDDFDLPGLQRAGSAGNMSSGGFIDLDDLDLDIPPPRPAAGGGAAAFTLIDDDLDLDLPPPKPKAAAAVLDDI